MRNAIQNHGAPSGLEKPLSPTSPLPVTPPGVVGSLKPDGGRSFSKTRPREFLPPVLK